MEVTEVTEVTLYPCHEHFVQKSSKETWDDR